MMDVLLLAERSPRGMMSRSVVLHHQGEARPGEVCSYVLTTRHHAHHPTHTADEERSERRGGGSTTETLFKLSSNVYMHCLTL